MKLSDQKKLSKHICRLLKVSEITYPIGRTPNGNLGITFNVNSEDFYLMFDSVPLSTSNFLEDENNIELKKMIEKYMFEQEMTTVFKAPQPGLTTAEELGGSIELPTQKKD